MAGICNEVQQFTKKNKTKQKQKQNEKNFRLSQSKAFEYELKKRKLVNDVRNITYPPPPSKKVKNKPDKKSSSMNLTKHCDDGTGLFTHDAYVVSSVHADL